MRSTKQKPLQRLLVRSTRQKPLQQLFFSGFVLLIVLLLLLLVFLLLLSFFQERKMLLDEGEILHLDWKMRSQSFYPSFGQHLLYSVMPMRQKIRQMPAPALSDCTLSYLKKQRTSQFVSTYSYSYLSDKGMDTCCLWKRIDSIYFELHSSICLPEIANLSETEIDCILYYFSLITVLLVLILRWNFGGIDL